MCVPVHVHFHVQLSHCLNALCVSSQDGWEQRVLPSCVLQVGICSCNQHRIHTLYRSYITSKVQSWKWRKRKGGGGGELKPDTHQVEPIELTTCFPFIISYVDVLLNASISEQLLHTTCEKRDQYKHSQGRNNGYILSPSNHNPNPNTQVGSDVKLRATTINLALVVT